MRSRTAFALGLAGLATAGLGGSVLPADIMRCADVALYTAKRNGGGSHVGSQITPAEPVA